LTGGRLPVRPCRARGLHATSGPPPIAFAQSGKHLFQASFRLRDKPHAPCRKPASNMLTALDTSQLPARRATYYLLAMTPCQGAWRSVPVAVRADAGNGKQFGHFKQ
jgi:hypothetical protein